MILSKPTIFGAILPPAAGRSRRRRRCWACCAASPPSSGGYGGGGGGGGGGAPERLWAAVRRAHSWGPAAFLYRRPALPSRASWRM